MSDGPEPLELESRTIDQLQVGDVVEKTRVVSAEDVRRFAEITGDFNPVHVDPEFAENSPFGRMIAHGPVALGLAGQIVGTRMPGLGTVAVSATIRHLYPIYVEDRVTTKAEVTAIDPETRNVTIGLTWKNQEGRLVAEGDTVVKPPRRVVDAPAPKGGGDDSCS
jgi:acyl dehydratase